VYGDLIHGVGSKNNKTYILPNVLNLASIKHCHPLDGVEVHPETICQFTGLTNKEGDEIYEGDKLLNPQGKVGRVEFHNGSFCLVVKETKVSITRIMLTEGFCDNKSIIGNIHDNN
jgi:hypothetical protein